MLAGLADMRYKVKAMDSMRSGAFHAGMIAYFLGFHYEEYKNR